MPEQEPSTRSKAFFVTLVAFVSQMEGQALLSWLCEELLATEDISQACVIWHKTSAQKSRLAPLIAILQVLHMCYGYEFWW